jgi:hypothetical protein
MLFNVSSALSALGYCSTEEFEKEAQAESQGASAAAMMTFFCG